MKVKPKSIPQIEQRTSPPSIEHSLQRITQQAPAHLHETLLTALRAALTDSSNAQRILLNLERFLHSSGNSTATLTYLATVPQSIRILSTLFAGSQFLTEILLRNPTYLMRLTESTSWRTPKSLPQLWAELQDLLTPFQADHHSAIETLHLFHQWELLRIGTCDLLSLFDMPTAARQLSNLADCVVRAALQIAAAQTHTPYDNFIVLAMGKLGGRELNYSSDIDLLFLCTEDATRYLKLGERLIQILSHSTDQGFLYRVDMRLRPWGRVGALVTSLSAYCTYLEKHARTWEYQALLKARPIAGNIDAAETFLSQITPFLYPLSPPIEEIRDQIHSLKAHTESFIRRRGTNWGDVKLGQGSIRDIEFVVQYLQMIHGANYPAIRTTNTLDALERLYTHQLLPLDAYRILTDGYIFLRTVEHHLQIMRYRQTHQITDHPEALDQLAGRLGFPDHDTFLTRYEEHRAAIRRVYRHYLEGVSLVNDAEQKPKRPSPQSEALLQAHLARMAPTYTRAFPPEIIQHHAELAARLSYDHLVEVEAHPVNQTDWEVTIIAYDYPGELSIICGLLFAYGFSIRRGNVFTYEPAPEDASPSTPRKIVDVFTVYPVRTEVTPQTWKEYAEDLANLLRLMHHGQQQEAWGELAKRVGASLQTIPSTDTTLYPIEIEIDNASSEHYTILRIDALDTIGFLYEFTNALALNHIYIAHVIVESIGNRVHDILYVTDANGNKITDPAKQHELRVATVLIKHFTHLLPHSPDPETALLHFREFLANLFQQPNWTEELASLERPEVLKALAQLLGVSEFLWDDFLRMQHSNLFPVVRDLDALATAKSRDQLQAELEALLKPIHDGPQPPAELPPWREVLNAFKDREMFRIDMRHILGHTSEFWDFAQELTDLAEVVVNAAYHLCHEDLRSVYGSPRLPNGDLCDMTVFALGKFGGRELGFASDIELMFIYAGRGETSGPHVISNAEFYERLVRMFIGAIYAKREGIFEIDLQLRPYGNAGSLAVSIDAFRRYFAPDGPAWPYERQALVKLRPVAGNPGLGEEVIRLRDEYVYNGAPFDVRAMRAMRERQIRHLVTGGTFNAKYSPGGLADLEYLIQGLQITYGHRYPELRETNTRQVMATLAQLGILSQEDYRNLRKAHTFLRWLIDGLRMVRGNAKDLSVPPVDSDAFAFLARRLRYGNDIQRLQRDIERYTTIVRTLSNRLLPT